MSSSKIKCTCGHSWNKSDSSKKDMHTCHVCGKDNVMENGGWLSKYEEGGVVQENYNDSDVSLPEGFVGMGNDTTGRNYSPSWNGQFQTGGTLPGAVGFTYARTAGSAPSEGKYAKKTMASAQNGQEMKFYQEGLDWKPKSMQNGGNAKELENDIKTARSTAFKTIQPSTYDDLKNMGRWAFNVQRETFDDPRSEEFWKHYLKQPGELKYLRPSEYQPEISKNKNAKYLRVDDELEKAIFESYGNLAELNKIMPANESGINKKYNTDDLQSFINANPGLADRNASGNIARALGNFSVSKGADEKGEYLSYYDKYDFPNWIQEKVKGEPYEVYGRIYYPKKEDGGIIKDNRGQWDHPGEVTEINSNEITMQGVPYDVLGVSNTGDTKLMKPGKNYKFKGEKVTEYPIGKNGINQLEAQPKKKLDDLLNFTNYNKPASSGWLDKFN